MLMKKFRLWPDIIKRTFESNSLKILFSIVIKSYYCIKKLSANWNNMCFLKLLKFEYPNTALFIDLILLFNPYINPLVIFDLNIFSIYFKCFLKVFSAIIIFLEIFSLALKYFLTTLSNLLKLLCLITWYILKLASNSGLFSNRIN